MGTLRRWLVSIAILFITAAPLAGRAMGPVLPPPPPPPPPTPPCDCSTMPTLGAAGYIAAFSIGNLVNLQGAVFGSGATIDGNMGNGPGGSVWLQGNAATNGRIYHHTGTTVTIDPTASAGGIVEKDMTAEVAALYAANAAFTAMTADQTFGALNSATTFSGNGCVNVIQVLGSITLGGNDLITISGTSEDYFIINVHGDITSTGSAGIVLNGMDPSHVIFNFVNPGSLVHLQGTAPASGTFLNPRGEIKIIGTAGGTGAYYSGVNPLLFQGDADFSAEPFACGNGICPDPEASGINIQTPSTPPTRSTGNRPFFYAYFDPLTFAGHLEAFRVAPNGTIKDEMGNDAVDPLTNELVPGRDPYWDAGVELATNAARTLYTTDGLGNRVTFDATVADETAMNLQAGEIPAYPNFPASGVGTLPQLRDAIISYSYGRDAFDEDGDLNFGELRPSVLGDIFRSNPVYIGTPTTVLAHEDGYGDFLTKYEQRDQMVYAGANDGIFHAFNAGDWFDQNDPDPLVFDVGDGSERFGYIPSQLLDQIKLVPRTLDGSGNRLAPGFVDGNIVAADAWLGDGSGTDTTKTEPEWATVAITAFREGGDGYLALDITNPDALAGQDHGAYPKLLWEFGDVDLGQSWSRPVITRLKLAAPVGTGDKCGRDDGDGDCYEVWVAIFGGGYEVDGDPNDTANYVDDPTNASWSDVTKSIYIVRLDTGAILAKVEFDVTGVNGPNDMLFSMASAPAALDLDGDFFTEVIYIGGVGGDLWKWDVSALGVDSDADTRIDNWTSGMIFRADPVKLSNGDPHYKSLYNPPAATFVNNELTLVFGTGERNELTYEGDPLVDDQNRLYVVRDANPTGASAFSALITEADLTDISATGFYVNPGNDKGYYIVGEEGEKFPADPAIFAGYAIVPSYQPPTFPACDAGEAHLYIFRLTNGQGYWDQDAVITASDRKVQIGWGIPSNPRISVASDPNDDKIFINTSDGQVLTITPPLRDTPESSTLYWRQNM